MVKKFVAVLGFVMAVNGFALANKGSTLATDLQENENEQSYTNGPVERGVVGDFFIEIGQVANVVENEGLLGGIDILADIAKNPDKKWFDKYPTLRAFINSFRSCLGCC